MSQKKSIVAAAVAVLVLATAFAATAAEKDKQKVKPYPHYWMTVDTSNQSIPGMPAEMSGFAGMFGGKNAFGPRRGLLLQLESPRSAPATPEAAHDIPPGQNMGASLPLITPKQEKQVRKTPEQYERPDNMEKPKGRMLLYWGCGEEIGKGQPRVFDASKMKPDEMARFFKGKTPTHQTAPSARSGWTYGEWPNSEDRKDVPRDSSLVGGHVVHGSYVPDIRFNLDKKRDFMDPVEFSSVQSTTKGTTKVEWKPVSTAIGYFATAMGHDQKSGDTIFWSASEVPEIGMALMDYLTPGDVSRFIKDKVVMDPSRTSCTVPPVFKEAAGAMLQFIAYGEQLDIVHPPKPKDPKQPWDPQWSVKVRLKSTGMTTLMGDMGDEGGGRKSRPPRSSKKPVKQQDEENSDRSPSDDDSGSGKSKGGVGDRLKGLFGW